jgi:hypothetical protein
LFLILEFCFSSFKAKGHGTCNIEQTETPTSKQVQHTKKTAVPQGLREVPKANDEHGCKHKGLLDLKTMPRNYLDMYLKEAGWLYNKPCKDCAKWGEFIDLTLLLKKRGIP